VSKNGHFLEAVIFDFDGTLAELVIDFTEMKRRVAATAVAYLPLVPPANGAPALEYAAALARAMGDAETARRFLAEVAGLIRDMEVTAAATARLFPETRPGLTALARAHVRCGIITRNCRAAVDQVFPDAGRFVGVVLTRDEARHVKPDPRHLLDALAALGVDPARSLMVGDHPMDVATGKAAGTLTAGVASGRIGIAELEKAGPDYLAGNVGELLAMVLGGEEKEEDASGGRGANPPGPL
jgi:phosphoglycolate phosphatase